MYDMDIRRILAAAALCASTMLAQEDGPRGGFGRQGRFMRPSPVFLALDADGDGVISAAELKNASAALKKLDKDGDGTLTAEEVRPNFGPPGERREGPGGPGPGGPGPGGGASDPVQTLMAFDKNGDGKLSKDEVPERMQGIFDRGDTNHDGVLTKDELQKLAQAQSAGGPPQGREGGPGGPGGPGGFMRFDPMLAALDADGDGVISKSEIANAPALLRKLDQNGDGQLTADEVRPNFNRGGRGNPEEMVSRMFQQFDKNGDGKLSKSEMPDRMQEVFERVDVNKDGLVTRDEFLKFVQTQGMGFGRIEGERRSERQ